MKAFVIESSVLDQIPSVHISQTGTNHMSAGRWDPKTGICPADIDVQIDQAFANVELVRKEAAGRRWQQVYHVMSHHVPLDDIGIAAMVRNFKKWMPEHQPIWPCVGVGNFGEPQMMVEIRAIAVDEVHGNRNE